jgi:hypothetical protein
VRRHKQARSVMARGGRTRPVMAHGGRTRPAVRRRKLRR